MKSYFDKLRPTYLEHWPDALKKLSLKTISLPLDRDLTMRLGSQSREFRRAFGIDRLPLQPLLEHLDPIVADFPSGAFLRLGGCSWKDAFRDGRIPEPVFDGPGTLAILGLESRRVTRHLRTCLHFNEPPWLHLREWHPTAQSCEYRCVMRRSRFMGGVYNSADGPRVARIHRVVDQRTTERVKAFFPFFSSVSPVTDIVFDLLIESDRVLLSELNPYMERTGLPGFRWSELSELAGKVWR